MRGALYDAHKLRARRKLSGIAADAPTMDFVYRLQSFATRFLGFVVLPAQLPATRASSCRTSSPIRSAH